MTNSTRKLIATVTVWIIATGVFFMYAVPKFSDGLIALEENDRAQQDQIKSLRDQLKSLKDMQADLDMLNKEPVKPTDYFTSDLRLVTEIQHVEDIAKTTDSALVLSISGTTTDAQPVKQSASGLFSVPYTIKLTSSYPGVVTFMRYLENSYFVSPTASLDLSRDNDGKVDATILSNFFIRK